jgi:histidine triad (HIT) family protein
MAKKEIPVEFIFENDNFFAILDQNQDIKGNSLIISKKHYTNLMDMPSTLGREMMDAVKEVGQIILKKKYEGFNVLVNNFSAADQIVMHAHIHVLPRKKGDKIKVIG